MSKKNEPIIKTETEQEQKPKVLWPWYVVLHNDDDHSFEYVIMMLQSLFGTNPADGAQRAMEIHQKGHAIVARLPKEDAIEKKDAIQGFGADPMIERCNGSMTASIEPADD